MPDSAVSIHYRIQSCRGRESYAERLKAVLPPAVVIVDEGEPNPWRGYQLCLSGFSGTHVCVTQDDAILCQNFQQAVERVVEARPDSVIQLWTGGLGGQTRMNYFRAMEREQRFSLVHGPGIHHVVCVLWPRQLAEDFLGWTKDARLPGRPPRSDDAIVGKWARETRTQVWATVPSLVEHDEGVPSTIRRYSRGHRGRRAILFMEEAPLDWF